MSTNPPACPGATYTIRSGDTLWGIARSLNISLDALIRANPGINPDALRVGQVICLPVTPVPPTECPSGSVSYTIRSGDTLYELARRYGTTVAAIQRANPSIDPNSLRVGQIICIPTAAVPPPTGCPAGLTPYTIRAGDTLFALARATGTTVAEIQRNNPGLDPNSLRVGQIICLPRAPEVPPPTGECRPTDRRYVVQPGDTYFGVAQRFGVGVRAIQAANPGVDPNNLVVGMIICVPVP